ncbi:unnamed protein product [Penicillium olsonii]|uniref:Zn(2)-C6 fungal-type domain-containing protein n=1 Tax=Penicillium olsonii TaxID=99116 RepID=A0A9W4HPU1_PENOL|nr:unnamed protein product [Penicillium olsonii]CAG8084237.1 unnamed protein product [Penicillium olsonii]
MMLRVQKSSSEGKNDPQYRLGARSCLACHRRKVRCDRGVPCTNCAKCDFTCVYPTKDKDRDEQRSPTLQRISDRLGRLETLLSHLVEPRASVSAEQQVHDAPIFTQSQRESKPWELLLNDGNNVQYVNNSNLRDLLQNDERIKTQRASGLESTPQLQNYTSTHTSPSQPGLLSNAAPSVLEFYPDSHLALQLWALYVKSVDPVLKILHIPTTQSAVIATILDPKSASASMVALTFAIYFAAITTLDHYDGPIELPLDRHALLKNYKTALDRLLLVTEVMNRPEIPVLQALAIYTTCLRVHETGRGAWILNGLAIRLAQSVGLHRDGASLRLSPFDTEIRLRLWWHLCVLDSRAPEDQGFELTIDVLNRGLRLPLNVDDNQLFPSMKQLPVESIGWTEMSFFLIQTESCRLLHPVLGTRELSPSNALSDLATKRQMIQEHTQYVSSKYGATARTTGHLPFLALQHFTTACKKMEFMLRLREEIDMQEKEDAGDEIAEVSRPSFKLACDGLESSSILLTGEISLGFKWLFTTYVPWYALAYVLRCLSNSPCGPNTDRAWDLIDKVFPRELNLNELSTPEEDGYSSIWKCLALLRNQALSSRNSQLSANDANAPVERVDSRDDRTEQGINENEPPPAYASAFPGYGMISEQELIPDPSQNIFSSFDFSMSGVPYLPEWNAVIHGSLMDGNAADMIE